MEYGCVLTWMMGEITIARSQQWGGALQINVRMLDLSTLFYTLSLNTHNLAYNGNRSLTFIDVHPQREMRITRSNNIE